MEFTRTVRGHLKLVFEGYSYTINNTKENRTYWRCTNRPSCSAGMITENCLIIGNPSQHTHAPNPIKNEINMVKEVIKARAEVSEQTPSSIVDDVTSNIRSSLAGSLPKKESLIRIVRRNRPNVDPKMLLTTPRVSTGQQQPSCTNSTFTSKPRCDIDQGQTELGDVKMLKITTAGSHLPSGLAIVGRNDIIGDKTTSPTSSPPPPPQDLLSNNAAVAATELIPQGRQWGPFGIKFNLTAVQLMTGLNDRGISEENLPEELIRNNVVKFDDDLDWIQLVYEGGLAMPNQDINVEIVLDPLHNNRSGPSPSNQPLNSTTLLKSALNSTPGTSNACTSANIVTSNISQGPKRDKQCSYCGIFYSNADTLVAHMSLYCSRRPDLHQQSTVSSATSVSKSNSGSQAIVPSSSSTSYHQLLTTKWPFSLLQQLPEYQSNHHSRSRESTTSSSSKSQLRSSGEQLSSNRLSTSRDQDELRQGHTSRSSRSSGQKRSRVNCLEPDPSANQLPDSSSLPPLFCSGCRQYFASPHLYACHRRISQHIVEQSGKASTSHVPIGKLAELVQQQLGLVLAAPIVTAYGTQYIPVDPNCASEPDEFVQQDISYVKDSFTEFSARPTAVSSHSPVTPSVDIASASSRSVANKARPSSVLDLSLQTDSDPNLVVDDSSCIATDIPSKQQSGGKTSKSASNLPHPSETTDASEKASVDQMANYMCALNALTNATGSSVIQPALLPILASMYDMSLNRPLANGSSDTGDQMLALFNSLLGQLLPSQLIPPTVSSTTPASSLSSNSTFQPSIALNRLGQQSKASLDQLMQCLTLPVTSSNTGQGESSATARHRPAKPASPVLPEHIVRPFLCTYCQTRFQAQTTFKAHQQYYCQAYREAVKQQQQSTSSSSQAPQLDLSSSSRRSEDDLSSPPPLASTKQEAACSPHKRRRLAAGTPVGPIVEEATGSHVASNRHLQCQACGYVGQTQRGMKKHRHECSVASLDRSTDRQQPDVSQPSSSSSNSIDESISFRSNGTPTNDPI